MDGDRDRQQGAARRAASTVAPRGMKLVLPVDGMSADAACLEQFVVVHMTTALLVPRNVTLAKLDLIAY